MGVIGGPFVERLHAMLVNAHPDVRYNAAVRLAHHGDAAAVEVLAEMLDQDEQAGVEAEKEKKMQSFKRALITVNALRGGATGREEPGRGFELAEKGSRKIAREPGDR